MAPPRVFLLPKSNGSSPSSNFTVISLPHPRTSVPTRFLLDPETGLHEITKITPPNSAPRSWLLTNPKQPSSEKPDKPEAETGEAETEKEEPEEKKDDKKTPIDWLGNGQTIQDGNLYVSTPLDPLFVLLPHLLPIDTPKTHFLPLDDILDTFTPDNEDEEDKDPADKLHWEAVFKPGSAARRQVESRIRVVCDTVDVGGDMAYKPSQEKVLAVLAGKCEEMVKGGLPKSMEDAFVVKVLAKPITFQEEAAAKEAKGEEGEEGEATATTTLAVGKEKGESEDKLPTPPDSQAAPPLLHQAPEEIKHLLRLRVAQQFLSGTYLPAHITTALIAHLTKIHDFSPLDDYISELKRLRNEAASLRSGDFSLKRNIEEGDGGAGKKRKKELEEEEEKKKKKNTSRGVRDLGKVNTRGMAKMTSFFKKKDA